MSFRLHLDGALLRSLPAAVRRCQTGPQVLAGAEHLDAMMVEVVFPELR
jgi:hypothetical protein